MAISFYDKTIAGIVCAVNIIAAATVCLALLLSGCTSSTGPTGPSAHRFPKRRMLLESPKAMRDDFTYPVSVTRQTLSWERSRFAWVIRFPPAGHAYAGVVFKYPIDCSADRASTTLAFTVEPAALAAKLSMALVDGTARAPRLMTDHPVPGAVGEPGRKGLKVRIPLADFPDAGTPVTIETGSDTQFDWSDIRELRIISDGGLPRGEIVIKDLRLEM